MTAKPRARRSVDETDEIRHPRHTMRLFGHQEAEQSLLASFRSGRMPHAFLIGGPRGIGKATLAYRMARFVLAHAESSAADVQQAASLAVAADHPVARAVAADAHDGLLVLERTAGEKGALRANIVVDQVRLTVGFFGTTATAAGWRICIVDAVDELKWPEAPNALLKVLEEPPARTLFLLISHAPARVLATIRSRCRLLSLRPLTVDNVARACADALGVDVGDSRLREAAAGAEGSVARALLLASGEGAGLAAEIVQTLGQLPHSDPMALHAIADRLGPGDRAALAIFIDTVERWLMDRLHGESDAKRMARIAAAWEKVHEAARQADTYNLDRRALVMATFADLGQLTH